LAVSGLWLLAGWLVPRLDFLTFWPAKRTTTKIWPAKQKNGRLECLLKVDKIWQKIGYAYFPAKL
jgi:hypothetical protein